MWENLTSFDNKLWSIVKIFNGFLWIFGFSQDFAQILPKFIKSMEKLKLTSYREDCKRKMAVRMSKSKDDISRSVNDMNETFEIWVLTNVRLMPG